MGAAVAGTPRWESNRDSIPIGLFRPTASYTKPRDVTPPGRIDALGLSNAVLS
jgi:hypothetical protein